MLTLELTFSGALQAALNKKTRSAAGNFKPSEFVRSLAEENGWRTSDSHGNSTIEGGDKRIPEELSWSGMSDVAILKDLAEKTVNADGHPYRGFIDERGAVHFRSAVSTEPEARKAYTFARDAMGEVEQFTPDEQSVVAALLGGGKADYVSIDSKNGKIIDRQTTVENAPSGGQRVVVNDATHASDLGAGSAARNVVISRDAEAGDAEYKARHNWLYNQQMKATLDVHGTHAVSVFDYVRVDYFRRNGERHFLSGLYQVMSITHDVSTGGWNTTFDLFRPGTQYTQDSIRIDADRKKDVDTPAAAETGVEESKRRTDARVGRRLNLVRHRVRGD